MQAGQKWSELDQMTRAELEQDCDFLGLIIMQVINFRQALEFPIKQLLNILKFFIMHALKVFKVLRLSHYSWKETMKIESGQSYNHTSPEFAQEGNIWGNSRTTPGNMAEWVYWHI